MEKEPQKKLIIKSDSSLVQAFEQAKKDKEKHRLETEKRLIELGILKPA